MIKWGEYAKPKDKDKLLKCPFCGSEATIYDYIHEDGSVDGIGDVGCKNVIIDKFNATCKAKYFHYSGKFWRTKKEAIGMWNYYCEMNDKGDE